MIVRALQFHCAFCGEGRPSSLPFSHTGEGFPADATSSDAYSHTLSGLGSAQPRHDALRHIRNTPKRVSGTSALRQAEKANASTRRVSEGRMMPSSQSRAVA